MFNWFRKKKAANKQQSEKLPAPVDSDLEYILSSVRYSTEPHDNILFSDEERCFFQELVNQCRQHKVNPREIRLTRMSNMGFNVDTHDGYIGKINFYITPDRYAVMKQGGKRAVKVFDAQEEANAFLISHNEYHIEVRKGENRRFMQYLIGMKSIKELHNPTLDECIAAIPYWIKHIKYCKRF